MSRRDIYYWKCDRPAAFHGTKAHGEADTKIEPQLREELHHHFDAKKVDLKLGAGQGNHLTWNAEVDGTAMFIRVENGPENDGHLAIESAVLDRVREVGVRTPCVFGCDASRTRVPFAWQALEKIAAPDLNHWFKQGTLVVPQIAFDIGVAVAKWQSITFEDFGPVGSRAVASQLSSNAPGAKQLAYFGGSHATYANYFRLRLDEHLAFLISRGFLNAAQRNEIAAEIERHVALLQIERGCFVHKDLALWNILGSRDQISAFIDFDDAIIGDPMDDLSLLACFHDAAFLQCVFDGYQSIRSLPEHHMRRFWLHLLRNMIVKAVIRVGAGYFDRDDGFFLISSGSSGSNLREMTCSRIALALRGLRMDSGLEMLST